MKPLLTRNGSASAIAATARSCRAQRFAPSCTLRRDQFKLLNGEPKTYVKISESGNPRTMAFCANCGTQLYGTGDGKAAELISLRVGTCNQRADLTPVRQIWRRSAVKWLDDLGIAESHERQGGLADLVHPKRQDIG